MIFINNVSMQFGGEYLFDGVSFVINDRDRIGLVGMNGAGKSTLMKILVGESEPESGDIQKPNDCAVGYLPQEGVRYGGRTLVEEVTSAFAHLEELQRSIEETQQQISVITDHESGEYRELLDRYGELQHAFEHHGGYSIQSQAGTVLDGLGFAQSDHSRLTEEFSGGWQMRIALAKLLLQKPDVLLLDEPTNHLDIESLTWLESWLKNYDGAIVLVSHDKKFLDNITSRTLEISAGDVYAYDGNYSTYLRVSAERRELLMAAFTNQQKKISEIERFIERFRYKATKARQVQSRIKMLERMQRIELEDEDRRKIHFAFPPAPPGGVVPIEFAGAGKRYGNIRVFEHFSLRIERGDRIAFLGRNGEGKSTLAKIIAGVEDLTEGECRFGYNIEVAYYAQQQAEALDGDKTVFETVEEAATGEMRAKLRSLLGAFLFQGDDVFKYVRVLSGGEKSRLALAKMLLRPANLLVLDEPTNHLDMRSKAVLKEALMRFNGTIIVVSHDRDFLDGLVNKVFEFKDHTVKEYLGGVQDWLWKKSDMQRAGARESAPLPPKRHEANRNGKRAEAEQRNHRMKKIKPLKDKIAKLEKEIAAAEQKKSELESVMANPDFYRDGGKAKNVSTEYAVLKEILNDLYFRWAEVNEELDRNGRDFGTPEREKRL